MRAFTVVAFVCALLALSAVADHVPYKYTISLDEEPEKRYYPAVFDLCRDEVHKTAFFTLLNALDNTLIAQMAKTVGKETLFALIDNSFAQRLPEVSKELKGISHYFQKYCNVSIPSGELATLQLIYQIAMPYIVEQGRRDVDNRDVVAAELYEKISQYFGMACTSLIVADSEGNVKHGRNLDWVNAEMYSPLTTELTFTRGGKPVAVTTSFFPELAPTTLVSPNIGFSYNARVTELQYDGTCMMKPGHEMDPFTLVIRQEVFAGVNYSTLFNQLNNSNFCAPAYIAISGPGKFEGAIFQTHINDLPEVRMLNVSNEDPEDTRDTWYVVVANDDLEFSNRGNWSDRYNFTLGLLANLTQEELSSSIDKLESEILNVSGVRRSDATCYMGVFDPKNFNYKFVVRSNITEDEFHQNTDIPPEEDSSSQSSAASSATSSATSGSAVASSSISGSAVLSSSYFVVALFVILAAISSRF